MTTLSAVRRLPKRKPAMPVSLPAVVVIDGYRRRGTTLSVSFSGAFIAMDVAGLEMGQSVRVEIDARNGRTVRCAARVLKIRSEGELGIAVAFEDPRKSDLRAIDAFLRQGRVRPRVSQPMPITVSSAMAHYEGLTKDVTIDGIFVASQAAPAIFSTGEPVVITLTMPDRRTLHIEGQVVRVTSEPKLSAAGFAIRYSRLPAEERDSLKSNVLRLSGT